MEVFPFNVNTCHLARQCCLLLSLALQHKLGKHGLWAIGVECSTITSQTLAAHGEACNIFWTSYVP